MCLLVSYTSIFFTVLFRMAPISRSTRAATASRTRRASHQVFSDQASEDWNMIKNVLNEQEKIIEDLEAMRKDLQKSKDELQRQLDEQKRHIEEQDQLITELQGSRKINCNRCNQLN